MLYPNDTNTNTRYVICISRVYVMFNTNEQPTMRIGPNVIMVEMLGLDIFEALSPPATAVAAATVEAAATRAATATAATEAVTAASAVGAPRDPVEGEGKRRREEEMEGTGARKRGRGGR